MSVKLLLPALLVIVAGAAMMTQQVMNANLRVMLNSAAWSGLASYAMGLLGMIVFALVMREPFPAMSMIARVPWWAWTGGLLGTLFITLAILLVPVLGAATFVALLVTGQMIVSVVFDHYGVMGLSQHAADWPRLLGIGFLVGGVLLIRL